MKVALDGGAYQSKSLIANAQRCVNLYPEKNPPDSPFPFTYYPTPGTIFQDSAQDSGARGYYRASTGTIYTIYNQTLQSVIIDPVNGPEFNSTILGTLVGTLTTPVSMSDNGLILVIVDGSVNGYCLELMTNNFAQIPSSINGPFYGADKVDYVDGYFIFNRPGTNQFYISLFEPTFAMMTSVIGSITSGEISASGSGYTNGGYNNVPLLGGSGIGASANVVVTGGVPAMSIITAGNGYVAGDSLSLPSTLGGTGFAYEVLTIGGAFDDLDIAAKNGAPDNITSLIVMHREIWLIGVWTSEVWYNSGASDFTFQALPGAFIEHGCAAKYSLCAQDLSVYFLSQDRQGDAIVLKGSEYQVRRISTHAIEAEFATYSTISDAIGFTYQQEGHTFYVLNFPTADTTWVYDEASELWHERGWTDLQGVLHAIRYNCYAYSAGYSLVGDRQTSDLYILDQNYPYDDVFDPILEVVTYAITRIRSFAHLSNELKRTSYLQFVADMQVGSESSYDIETQSVNSQYPPIVSLRFSDNKGQTFSNALNQSLGAAGEYLTTPSWNRLGMARDRVFELSWSCPGPTALNGAYIEVQNAGT